MKNRLYPLTVRGLITGILGLIVITTSSMYTALKMGALPWPTVFVTVVSMAVLSKAKGSTLQEINCTHTLMSAGAMVAGGLAFTLPGLWMINPSSELSLFSVIVVSVTGAILGTLFTSLNRKHLIEEEKLPYPMGNAAYNTLACTKDRTGALTLFSSMGGSVLFTLIRDAWGKIPSVLTVFSGNAYFPALQVWVSPMALGIGAVIGPVLAGMWFLGMVLGYYVITPIGTYFFGSELTNAFRNDLGIGLMIGTGIGIFIKAVYSIAKKMAKKENRKAFDRNKAFIFLIICLLSITVLALLTEITLAEAILLIPGVYLATYLSAMLTGQTGVNPMEVFAILVLLFVAAVLSSTLTSLFLIAATVAVASGLTGDVMNDLKSGYMLKTPVSSQLVGEGIGGVIGAVVASLVLFALKEAYGSFGAGTLLPAPQASAVSLMVSGLSSIPGFVTGLIIGALLYLLKAPSATLGLGVYLATNISSIMGLGALCAFILRKTIKDRDKCDSNISLVSSGFLGGEGITGVLIAIASMF